MSLTRDRYSLMHYGYPKDSYEKFEFYDLDADPEEMNDLYPSSPAQALQMKDELLQNVSEVNRAFERNGM